MLCSKSDTIANISRFPQILLENILPAHVAEHFLSTRNTQDLYHERYSCVAVMFASIPNYKEFYDESDVNKQGLECLRLLNEIICEFDKVRIAPCIRPFFISISSAKDRLIEFNASSALIQFSQTWLSALHFSNILGDFYFAC